MLKNTFLLARGGDESDLELSFFKVKREERENKERGLMQAVFSISKQAAPIKERFVTFLILNVRGERGELKREL